MSRILSDLLGTSEPLLAATIKRLEDLSGNLGIDVRLSAEIIGKVQMKSRELGLDPRDTTGPELYQALLNVVRLHDEFLVRKIGGTDATDVDDLLPRIRTAVLGFDIPKTAWALKHSAARKLLKNCPPKHVMKTLGYKSLDSMIKREPVPELFAALTFLETEDWLKNFHSKYANLKPSDFETRKIEIVQLKSAKWGSTAEHIVKRERHNILFLKELGAIIMLPLPIKSLPGLTITALPMLMHYMGEVRMHSAYFKLYQMHQDFGKRLVRSMIADADDHIHLSGQKMHWRIVQRHFGKAGHSSHPEVFEPHVTPEDLWWRKAEEVLYKLEPALHFWNDMDFVGSARDSRVISFNLMDMALNYINKLSYDNMTDMYLKSGLWDELCLRYASQPAHEAEILRQLDSSSNLFGQEVLGLGGRRR